jgi:hypothetical protein
MDTAQALAQIVGGVEALGANKEAAGRSTKQKAMATAMVEQYRAMGENELADNIVAVELERTEADADAMKYYGLYQSLRRVLKNADLIQ